MFALSFVGKVTSASTQHCHPGPLGTVPLHSGLRVCDHFQFKALICMCEMCCSGVKCSAVPSSSEIARYSRTDGGEKERLEG